MRCANALLLAGALTVATALTGSSLAAEESGRDVPQAGLAAVDEPAPAGEAAGAAGEPSAPPQDAGRDLPHVPTEAVDEDPGRPKAQEKRRGAGRDRSDGKEKPKQPRASKSVTIKDFDYRPDPITVSPGDEVTWTNRDTAQHTATASGKGDFDTGLLKKGERGTVPFNDPGSYAYFCTVHPDMKGKVVVRSTSSTRDSGGSTGGGTGSPTTDPLSPSGSSGSFSTDPRASSSSGGGSLPNTGQAELPLLLFGTGLIVLGLLARALHEHWIWR